MYQQLNFFWKGTLPFQTMNGDFLGPTSSDVRHLYQNLLQDDCEVAIKKCQEQKRRMWRRKGLGE